MTEIRSSGTQLLAWKAGKRREPGAIQGLIQDASGCKHSGMNTRSRMVGFLPVIAALLSGCSTTEVRQPTESAASSLPIQHVEIKRPAGPVPSIDFLPLVNTPPYSKELKGNNEVKFRNRNEFPVLVAVRSGDKGRDIRIPADSIKAVNLPDGEFRVYVMFSVEPGSLYRGDYFRLPANDELEIEVPDLTTH
jgi:hypothetical protein